MYGDCPGWFDGTRILGHLLWQLLLVCCCYCCCWSWVNEWTTQLESLVLSPFSLCACWNLKTFDQSWYSIAGCNRISGTIHAIDWKADDQTLPSCSSLSIRSLEIITVTAHRQHDWYRSLAWEEHILLPVKFVPRYVIWVVSLRKRKIFLLNPAPPM